MKIRPIEITDLDQLLFYNQKLPFGNAGCLRGDRKAVKSKIKKSIQSFRKTVQHPNNEYYWFVLEHNGEIIGTCGIANYKEGIYCFKLGTNTTMQLEKHFSNTSHMYAFYVLPKYRGVGYGRLLSEARWEFIQNNRNRFFNKLLAEFRGIYQLNGISPFFQALGTTLNYRKYIELLNSDLESSIIKLIPKEKIFIKNLPLSAQNVINKSHKEALLAMYLSKSYGFKKTNFIGYSSGAPIMECSFD